jgi:four helix bundle protein
MLARAVPLRVRVESGCTLSQLLARSFVKRPPGGTRNAARSAMAVRDFQGLVCWQLSHELKCEVFDFTSQGPASQDFKYRDQIRASSASAPSNIAEGFGRFRPGEFAQYLAWARASLIETHNHLIDGRDRRYLTEALFTRLANLAGAARRTTTKLMLAKQRQAEEARRRRRPLRKGHQNHPAGSS